VSAIVKDIMKANNLHSFKNVLSEVLASDIARILRQCKNTPVVVGLRDAKTYTILKEHFSTYLICCTGDDKKSTERLIERDHITQTEADQKITLDMDLGLRQLWRMADEYVTSDAPKDPSVLDVRIDHTKFLWIKKDPSGTFPTKAYHNDVGFDCYASENVLVEGHTFGEVQLGLSFRIPKGYWIQLVPRSSTAKAKGFLAHHGIIDCDYEGPISLYVFNMSTKGKMISKGEKICQFILHKQVVDDLTPLNKDGRGEKGVGSSGH